MPPPVATSLAKVWWPVVLTWLLYVLPPLLATLALGELVISVWPRVNLILVFLAVVVLGLWVQVFGAAKIARAGMTAEDVRRFQLRHASGVSGAYDTTDFVDAYARIADSGPETDAARELPALQALVAELAGRFGLEVPTVALVRGGNAVVVRAKASSVVVGTGFLTVASSDELRAQIARQLAPFGAARGSMRALIAARGASAAGAWRPPGLPSRLDFLWWPATQASLMAAEAGRQLAAELCTYAATEAAAAASAAVADSAHARGLALPELWRDHVRSLQRSWTSDGTAMAPHEGWAAAWAARHAAGSPVAVDSTDLLDVATLCGWPPTVDEWAAVPPLAMPTALEFLAGAGAADVLARFDQVAASQYYEPVINASFGAAVLTSDEEAVQAWGAPAPTPPPPVSGSPYATLTSPPGAAPGLLNNPLPPPATPSPSGRSEIPPMPYIDEQAAPVDARFAPIAVDPRAGLPHVDLILRQLDALDEAMHRRDAAALATARAVDFAAQTPTVKAMAAGVRWLCGDPEGLTAIHAALAKEPRGVGALVDLVPALRAAGAVDTARAVEVAVVELEQIVGARFDLRKMWGRAPKLVPAVVPPGVHAALTEIAGLYKGRIRVYLADVDVPTGSMRPTVLVAVKSFWTLRIKDHEGDPAALARLVWPATRILDTDSVEARGRKRLRKTFTPLG